MEIRLMDDKGLEFLIKEEGLRLKPYLDSRKIPTIGIGCTYYEDGTKVKMTDPSISKERALSLFKNIREFYEKAVYSVTRDDINQNQFNSLTSICYNIGIQGFKGSTLLKRVNADPNDPRITEAFKMWRNSGGKPILLGRRIREAKLYFS
jgi:lysozyme